MTAFPGASTATAGAYSSSLFLLFLFFFNHIVDLFIGFFRSGFWQWDIPFLWNGHGVPRPDNKSVCGVGNL